MASSHSFGRILNYEILAVTSILEVTGLNLASSSASLDLNICITARMEGTLALPMNKIDQEIGRAHV